MDEQQEINDITWVQGVIVTVCIGALFFSAYFLIAANRASHRHEQQTVNKAEAKQ